MTNPTKKKEKKHKQMEEGEGAGVLISKDCRTVDIDRGNILLRKAHQRPQKAINGKAPRGPKKITKKNHH